MPKKKVKKSSVARHKAPRKHVLFREIPQLHALTVVFYILILILFIAIYYTRFA